jgi:hypothetical protein
MEIKQLGDPTNSRYRYIIFKGSNVYRRFITGDENRNIESAGLKYSENDVPAHGTYGALLFHPLWRSKREEILKRDLQKCVICRNSSTLQVHHRQYHFVVKQNQFKMPWDYSNELLISLCESCHKRGHSKFKVPIINL